MSSATSVNDALTGYAAGRVTAEQLVGVLAAAYYGALGLGTGAWVKPVMEVVERAHPGIVELSGTNERPGFSVRLQERPFPKRYERELREAVESVLAAVPASVPTPQALAPRPGLLTRIVRAIRKVFSA